MEGGFPFQIKQPRYNHQTKVAMQKAHDILTGKVQTQFYTSVDDLFNNLEDE